MFKLVATLCTLSFMSNVISGELAASEVANGSTEPSHTITQDSALPEYIQASCKDQPAKRRLSRKNLSIEKKFEILAEKLDHLTVSAEELSCKNRHINSQTQEYLEGEISGLFVSADLLYWQADEDKLEYVINFNGGLGNSQVLTEKFAGLNFEWNPGFRVAIGGMSCDYDHWGLYLNYTQIRNKAHGSFNAPFSATNFTVPAWDQLLAGALNVGGHAHWSVDYSTEHFEAYKDYFSGRHLIFRPHMGLINANINQEYHVRYQLVPDLIFTTTETKMRAKCNYWGFGIGGGTDILWHFTPHFGIYGEFSLGILYGKFNVKRDGDSVFPFNNASGIGEHPFTFHFKKEMWRTRATVQTALGFEWETIFNRDRNRIAINLGYEFNAWFQQNQFVSSSHNLFSNLPGEKNGVLASYDFADADLAFKGGTLRATLDF